MPFMPRSQDEKLSFEPTNAQSTKKIESFDRFAKHIDRTFAEAADRYLKEIGLLGKGIVRPQASLSAVMPYVGHMRLIDIDDEAVTQFKIDRTNGTGHFKKPAMAGTTNKDLVQIQTVINRACRIWRWLPSTPLLVHVQGDTRKGYPITWAQQDLYFRALPSGWDVLAALFAINTGVRKSELFGLKWTDKIDVPELGEGVFVFILNRTKNGEQRAVICNSIARRAVNYQLKYQQKHGMSEYVFPTRSGGSRCRASGKVWSDAWKRAGLPDKKLVKKGMHNLRHSAGHRLRAAGVSDEDRNAILGHARTNLSEHYALPDLKRLLEAVEKITERRDTVVLRSNQ